MSTHPDSAPLGALIDVLAGHRVVLFVGYVLLLVGLGVVVVNASVMGLPAVVHMLVPDNELFEWKWSFDYAIETVLLVGAMVALQALFIFGGGRIPVGRQGHGVWRIIIPIGAAGVVLVSMLVTLLFAIAEIFDRTNSEGSIRESAIIDLEKWEPDAQFLIWLLLIWLVWLIAAAAMFRKSDQETVIRRLTSALLAGSWVEFLVALPVELAIRPRTESCPCETGSWIAMMVAIPSMVFAFGPALYLLYLREVERGRTEPNRVTRILLHRSRRQRAAATGGRDE